MKISGKNWGMAILGALAGIGLVVATAMMGWFPLGVQIGGLVGGVACWGLALGALTNCPWRGLLIALLSATSTLFSYLVLIGKP
jgi:hypothetical protein